MNIRALMFLVIPLSLLSQHALASAELARASNCLACHAADKKVVGPSYQDVAKKYKGQKDAEARIAAAIKSGGKGVWGEVAMPPNPALKDDDAKALAVWIMAGAK